MTAPAWLTSTPAKLAAYSIGLVLIFGVATGAGRVIGPDQAPTPATSHGEAHGDTHAAGETAAATHVPGGLQIAQDGYRLQTATQQLSVQAELPFAFRVLGPDGEPVTAYRKNHDKDLHLIAVRRDLSGFQHVHPTMAADGTWTIPLSVDTPGQYRVLADFQPADAAEAITLGVDVPAPGDYRPIPLPPPARTAEVDGYTVTLTGDLRPGEPSDLALTVTRNGQPVTDLEPYLGALGHLVVLREGDLAYLHVHPTADDALRFRAEVPSPGVYRLYLDFQHAGTVRTAEFTATTAGVTPPSAPPPAQEPAETTEEPHTHD
ncbi:FixH family protein [Actinoplanes couchii]|uniref:Secreted protein n=1 Tax=Actinoplanes couchii TaxID=403638 RepID=A0ABQ3XFM0_9ACTN|nr:FixH family protein [Actinoplanes couchii]MDR6321745.1 hypothetical protein [Actinoplanes couchii]GID57298.1 hypothetical protein Aco03nite_057020 [Actinoplanes couchii]